MIDKLSKAQFFQETFLLAHNSIKVVLKIGLITFSNVNIWFAKKKLTWRFYTIKKALSTPQQVEFINKRAFAKVALDKNTNVFVVHMSCLSLSLR